jgi:hypothetical protein
METGQPAPADGVENWTTALLGAGLVGGVYADGWAHLNLGDLDSFFTPWHGLLYGAFTLLAGWSTAMLWRRRRLEARWRNRAAGGYGWGLVGIAVFAVGGLLDMGWHTLFGLETGLDALVSPTHLLLLTGGVLLIASPLRAADHFPRRPAWSAVLSLAAATSLAGFFLIYVSVFVDPGAREPLTSIPEDAAGHREAELFASAGMASYLVTTVLLVAPLLFLGRRGALTRGAVTVLVAAVALPAATLSQLEFAVPAIGAVAGAAVVDLLLVLRPSLAPGALGGLVPALVWAGQLAGLATIDMLRWPVPLWSGVVLLSALLGLTLAWLTRPGRHPASAADPVPVAGSADSVTSPSADQRSAAGGSPRPPQRPGPAPTPPAAVAVSRQRSKSASAAAPSRPRPG